MNLNDLEKAIEVQRKAYGLLLWLKERAKTNPSFWESMAGEPFATGEACAEWVGQRVSSFPESLRPQNNEIRKLGFVLSSFFGTSFRIAQVRAWEQVGTALVAGATSFRDRRHRRHAERKREHNAVELRRLALSDLAAENNLVLSAETFERAMAEEKIAAALTLWTYGCELVRRCQYASQGPAVHHLWLELDLKTRKNLSADLVWKARGQLVEWLARNQATQPSN